MKRLILALTISLFSLTNLIAQWEILNEGFKGGLSGIDFINDDTGWITGWGPELYKTIDGGENWTSIAINESLYIGSADFLNESIAWAIGYDGYYPVIFKTIDGGVSWSVQKQLLDIWLSSIYVVDENNVYAIGYNKVFKTSNGGSDWNDISPILENSYYNSLWFQNPEIGVVVGGFFDGTMNRGIIFKTTDGGSTWHHTIVNEFSNITDLQFLNDTTGYFGANSNESNFLCKTEDLFETWAIKTQSPYQISSYQLLDSSTVFAIINDTLNHIMKSTDGGTTWQNIQTFQCCLNKIYFCNSNIGLLIGGFGLGYSTIYRSTDSGYNWETKRFTYPFSNSYFINKDEGIISGYIFDLHSSSSNMFSTTDGGNSWNIGNNLTGALKSFFIFNNLTGFYLTEYNIYKSSNFGNDWIKVYENNPDSSGYYFWGSDICFFNDETGWAVGKYSITDSIGTGILGTTDGGTTWYLLFKYPDVNENYYDLSSICFSETTGWTVGSNGLIVKYTPQTNWVKQTSSTNLPLKKVFSLSNNVWIAGGYSNDQGIETVFLKSTNNGQIWTQYQTNPYLIHDICFINNSIGWAVGRDTANQGVILKSTNGGDSWDVIIDNLLGPLNSIFIKDNFGWAVGEYGLILKTTDLGINWIDDKNNKIYPTEFKLEQNYPNPFNPSTKISWQSPVGSWQTLKVYDMLGNEVAILVDEYKPAGKYEIEFNLVTGNQHLASGVYFYELKAGIYKTTKKMMILK